MEKTVEFLKFIIQNLVDNIDEININVKEDDLGIFLTLKVSKDDMPKIIGKGGANVQALRTVLRLYGAKNNQRVTLKVLDPEEEI